jgi:predicted NAD/FAD-dependent oxidoreductase
MVTLVPCLTVLVELEEPTPLAAPLLLPRSPAVQLISDESDKRPSGGGRVVVVQARPGWSAAHLEEDPAAWSAALIAAAKPHCAPLSEGRVRSTKPHRWRWARLAGPGLAGPILGRTASGARFGIAGDALDPVGGLEGAWRSGQALARRILEDRP